MLSVNGLMKQHRLFTICLVIALIMSLFPVIADSAYAASSRDAIVEQVTGEVYVKKAGGTKQFRVYTNMALSQGDYITTMERSGVVLSLADREDQITLGEHVELYISELIEDDKGKKSKLKLWAGTVWAKVSSLFGTDDEFEIETPTAIMGVRGTTLMVGTDPSTGETGFFLASGEGHIIDRTGSSPVITILNPYDVLNIDDEVEPEEYEQYRNIAVDMDQIVSMASRSIVESFIASWEQIADEHEQYIAHLNDEASAEDDEEEQARYLAEIARIQHNLDLMIGQLMQRTVQQGVISQAEMATFISQVNASLITRLYEDERALQLTEAEQERQARIDELLAQRALKQAERDEQREQQREDNEDTVEKIIKQQDELREAEREREEQERREAEERYKEELELAERLRFENEVRNREQEERQQEAERDGLMTPPPTPPSGDGGSGPSDQDEEPVEGPGEDPPIIGPVSTVTSMPVDHNDYPMAARLMFAIYDEQGEPVTGLTAEDVRLSNVLTWDDYLSLVELESDELILQVIEDFTESEQQPGQYSVVVKSSYDYPAVKTMVMVEDEVIAEHLYIIFAEYQVPSKDQSDIGVEFCLFYEDCKGPHENSVTMVLRIFSEDEVELFIAPEDVLLIRENGEVIMPEEIDEEDLGVKSDGPRLLFKWNCGEGDPCLFYNEYILEGGDGPEPVPFAEWVEIVVRGVSMGEFYFTNYVHIPPSGIYVPTIIEDGEGKQGLVLILVAESTEVPLQAADFSFYADGNLTSGQFGVFHTDTTENMSMYFVGINEVPNLAYDEPYELRIDSEFLNWDIPFKVLDVELVADQGPDLFVRVTHANPKSLSISYYDFVREVIVEYDETNNHNGIYEFEVPYNSLYGDSLFQIDGIYYIVSFYEVITSVQIVD